MQKIKNGSLLIAHPTMIDDTFFKSIILITHHNNDESIGLVINNPSKIKLHEKNGQSKNDEVNKELN